MEACASVFWFNPFAEGYIAQGKAFNPIKHQAALAQDLANLPQFLGQPSDIVLIDQRPSAQFLSRLQQAGFEPCEFVELSSPTGMQPPGSAGSPSAPWSARLELGAPVSGAISPARKLGGLRPWAWSPESAQMLEPLFAQIAQPHPAPSQWFNPGIAQLYSKAWSAELLRRFLSAYPAAPWLCPVEIVGMPVRSLPEALQTIVSFRAQGYAKLIAKETIGVAGHNALRLWEPELLEVQRRWLAKVLDAGRPLVIEPWLEREVDFSVQLEMTSHGLKLCGYTGLLNDRKGQFLANRADADHVRCLPAAVTQLFSESAGSFESLHQLYAGIFSLLETELRRRNYCGPAGLDAFVYRAAKGQLRLKPIVELNPRYTMGRLTVELMRHVGPGSQGLFRLVTLKQARAEGCRDFMAFARLLEERYPLHLEGNAPSQIREGALCLSDPARAQVCLATFRVSRSMEWA